MLGKRIKKLRKERDFEVLEMAKKVKINPNTLRSIEWGLYKPSFRMIVRIAAFLDVDTKYLLNEKNRI